MTDQTRKEVIKSIVYGRNAYGGLSLYVRDNSTPKPSEMYIKYPK